MKVIGITGGIGTGKSTVSNYLRQKGCLIIDADDISRKMTGKGGEALESIREAFGNGIFFDDGSLNRKKLGEIVFSDPIKLQILERITTEVVVKKITNTLEELKNNKFGGVVVIDAPLLFECGMENIADENWLVSADMNIRVSRIMERDGLSEQKIIERINSQMPEDEKKKLADIFLNNSGSIESLYGQIDRLIERVDYEK